MVDSGIIRTFQVVVVSSIINMNSIYFVLYAKKVLSLELVDSK